jgi:hypothetical protein
MGFRGSFIVSFMIAIFGMALAAYPPRLMAAEIEAKAPTDSEKDMFITAIPQYRDNNVPDGGVYWRPLNCCFIWYWIRWNAEYRNRGAACPTVSRQADSRPETGRR